MVLIGDVCIIKNGTPKRIDNNIVGEYPVYGSGHKILFYTNVFNREGQTCKISKFKSNLLFPIFFQVFNLIDCSLYTRAEFFHLFVSIIQNYFRFFARVV